MRKPHECWWTAIAATSVLTYLGYSAVKERGWFLGISSVVVTVVVIGLVIGLYELIRIKLFRNDDEKEDDEGVGGDSGDSGGL